METRGRLFIIMEMKKFQWAISFLQLLECFRAVISKLCLLTALPYWSEQFCFWPLYIVGVSLHRTSLEQRVPLITKFENCWLSEKKNLEDRKIMNVLNLISWKKMKYRFIVQTCYLWKIKTYRWKEACIS